MKPKLIFLSVAVGLFLPHMSQAITTGVPQLPDARPHLEVPAKLLVCPHEGLNYEIDSYVITISEKNKDFAQSVVTVMDILTEGSRAWNFGYSHDRPDADAAAEDKFVPSRIVMATFKPEKFTEQKEYIDLLKKQAEAYSRRIRDNDPPPTITDMFDPPDNTPENFRAAMESIVTQSLEQATQLEKSLRDKNAVIGELLAVPGVKVECWSPWRSGVSLSN